MPELPELGAVVRIEGVLYECVGTGSGTTIYFQRVGSEECPTCGKPDQRHYLLHAPNYQREVRPVATVSAPSGDVSGSDQP